VFARLTLPGGIAALMLAVGMAGAIASGAAPGQRGGFGGFDDRWTYDGSFVFCRISFRQSPNGDGNGWYVDYPRADLNLSFRLGQLTTTPISRDDRGEPNHVVLGLTDEHLYHCPFVMMTEPGGAYFDASEAAALRDYLDKGGFLWADDFWGEYAWQAWEYEIRKVFPEQMFKIVDLPLTHPIFHMQYEVTKIPQIPSINFWLGTGQTSERADSTVPHVRAISAPEGRVMVLMTHNTDFGDAFEREGDNRAYFDHFAAAGYAFGVNVILYALSH
jgi:hypothetical protein